MKELMLDERVKQRIMFIPPTAGENINATAKIAMKAKGI